jgi:hypothetical protein
VHWHIGGWGIGGEKYERIGMINVDDRAEAVGERTRNVL